MILGMDYSSIQILFLLILISTIGFFLLGKISTRSGKSVIDVPHQLKCALNESNCENNNITFFTLYTSLFFGIGGYYIPNQYILALIVSVGIQFCRLYFGVESESSFIIDPLANMTFYAVGNCLRPVIEPEFIEKYKVYVD